VNDAPASLRWTGLAVERLLARLRAINVQCRLEHNRLHIYVGSTAKNIPDWESVKSEITRRRPEIVAYPQARGHRDLELATLTAIRGRLIEHNERSQGRRLDPDLRAEYGTLYQDMRREWFTSCAVACHAYKLARCILIEAGMTKPCDGELLCPRCVQARSARSVPPKPTVEDLIVMASEAMYGPARAS